MKFCTSGLRGGGGSSEGRASSGYDLDSVILRMFSAYSSTALSFGGRDYSRLAKGLMMRSKSMARTNSLSWGRMYLATLLMSSLYLSSLMVPATTPLMSWSI